MSNPFFAPELSTSPVLRFAYTNSCPSVLNVIECFTASPPSLCDNLVLPDQTFHSFRALKSDDRRILYCSRISA